MHTAFTPCSLHGLRVPFASPAPFATLHSQKHRHSVRHVLPSRRRRRPRVRVSLQATTSASTSSNTRVAPSSPPSSSSSSQAASPAPTGLPSGGKVFVREGIEGGRGVVVGPERVHAGEVVARVPLARALVVSFEDALPDSARDDFPFEHAQWVSVAYWRSADWDSKLCALLLYHRSLAVSSPWSAYISALPQADELWTAADLSHDAIHDLQYTPMMDAVECYQYRVGSEFARFKAALPLSAQQSVTKQLFEWAMKVVHSRAFSIPPGGFAASSTRTGLRACITRENTPAPAEWPRKFALVPLLDMMNHGCGTGLARFRFDASHDCFELVAGERGFEPASQVLVSYGNLPNDDLLLLYGFVQAGNPSDVFEVEDLPDWTSDLGDPHHATKVALLEQVGLIYEGRRFYVARTGVDPHLAAALRVLLADRDELRMAIAATRKHGRGVVPPEWYAPFSEENEMRVWARIEIQCARLLAEFPTSLDTDEEMIILLAASSGCTNDVSVSAPLLFRVEKKRILRDAVQFAAVKQLCIATKRSQEAESLILTKIAEAAPPPPETWDSE